MLLVIDGKTYDPALYDAIRGKIGSIEDGIVWIKNSTEALNRGASEVPSKHVGCQPALLKIEVTIKRGSGEYYLCGYYAEDSEDSSSQSKDKNSSNSQSGSSVAKPPSGNSANTSNDGKRENSAAKSEKTSNASSNSSKTTASLAKSSKSASNKGGNRKIIKIVERGSR